MQVKINEKKNAERHMARQWKELTIGTIHEFDGVPCVLMHVNHGKRRLTLTPVSGFTRVPAATSDPVIRSER